MAVMSVPGGSGFLPQRASGPYRAGGGGGYHGVLPSPARGVLPPTGIMPAGPRPIQTGNRTVTHGANGNRISSNSAAMGRNGYREKAGKTVTTAYFAHTKPGIDDHSDTHPPHTTGHGSRHDRLASGAPRPYSGGGYPSGGHSDSTRSTSHRTGERLRTPRKGAGHLRARGRR